MDYINGLISIILPVYNRENYIKECLDSILNQSYENFEVVIVDDGSTDTTLKICNEIAEKDPRIKVLKAEHGGVSAARNIGLENAKGEYVFFLDSDDIINRMLLETLVLAMKEKNAKISGTNIINVNQNYWEKAQRAAKDGLELGNCTYQNFEESVAALFGGASPLNMLGGTMMRRDWIGTTRFRTDLFISEDYYFVYENLVKGADTVFLQEKWYYYRAHSTNSSWNYSYEGFYSRFYRRQLVWQNEAKCGRIKNCNRQKTDAFYAFFRCLKQNKPYSEDAKKMRTVMKENRKEILSVLDIKRKILFITTVYMPFLYPIVFRK